MDSTEGKAAGGHARAEALTPTQRKKIAVKAAKARWENPTLKATHGSLENPLRIGEIEIPCYVLEDGTRVLSQRGLMGGLGVSQGSGSGGDDRLTTFLSSKAILPHTSKDLMALLKTPIKFIPPHGGRSAYGYPATILADICDAILAARKKQPLSETQKLIAERCEILVRGFARVGIIALVDEATGYEKDKKKDDLARILEAFIAKELQPYLPTFSSEFYEGIFRLRGLSFPRDSVKRPLYFGHITNDIVYKRLAPLVLEELKKVTPKDSAGRNKHKFFQMLTANKGYPKLTGHLGSVVTIMKLSKNWKDFMEKLNALHPPYNQTLPLPFEAEKEPDTGEGL